MNKTKDDISGVGPMASDVGAIKTGGNLCSWGSDGSVAELSTQGKYRLVIITLPDEKQIFGVCREGWFKKPDGDGHIEVIKTFDMYQDAAAYVKLLNTAHEIL